MAKRPHRVLSLKSEARLFMLGPWGKTIDLKARDFLHFSLAFVWIYV
jgi:hypothetical protein